MVQKVKNLPAIWETGAPFLGQEDPLEKGMPAHSSMLALRIPGKRSLAGCSSWGHRRVGPDLATTSSHILTANCICI